MVNMDIYFICQDEEKPVGGVRKLYRHVDVLVKNGVSASILHEKPGFRCTWFENNTPVVYMPQVKLTGQEIMVVPEIHGAMISSIAKGTNKVIFNQNCHYTFWHHTLEKNDLNTPYLNDEIMATIVVSKDSFEYLSYVFPEHKILRILLSVDERFFSYSRNKKRQIAFMPRKNSLDIIQVINILKFRGVLNDYDLVSIDEKSEEEVGGILRESLVFLTFGYPEGFGLPAAEAMACGCITIGFHGMGGKEFMKPAFSFPVQQGEIQRFAKTVEEVINIHKKDPRSLEIMGCEASEFIKRNYSSEQEEKSIIQAWFEILKDFQDRKKR
ncbi:MAG: glycosyltransferase [Candidatus Pacebacteria bacterium]|nr:glycosyltransferase [Candidatus Paceibacterota bacterium]